MIRRARLVDISLSVPSRPSRWHPGYRLPNILVTRARMVLLLLLLSILGWSAVSSLSIVAQAAQNCDTTLGKLYDRVHNRLFKTPLRCGCDGRLDLSTGCALPMLH